MRQLRTGFSGRRQRAAAEPEDYRLLQESWKYQWQQNIYDIIIQGTLVAGGDILLSI